MPIYLAKAFARKPDLILQLTGTGPDLALTLLDHGFVLRGTPEDVKKDDTTQVVDGRVVEQKTFEVDMRVSSKHLIETSTYFDTLLDGKFSEGRTTDSSDFRRIPLKDVDPNAFSILMDVLHLRVKDLARRQVDLHTLYQICVLVDMYAMHDQTSDHTDRWFFNLEDKYATPNILLHAFGNLQPWICISYLLRKSQSFKRATAYALENRTELLWGSTMPLPVHIQETLHNRRRTALEKCADALRKIVNEYTSGPKSVCKRERDHCGAMMLGNLIREFTAYKMYPFELETFQRFRVSEILKRLTDFPLRSLCGFDVHRSGFTKECESGLAKKLNLIEDTLANDMGGLDLPEH